MKQNDWITNAKTKIATKLDELTQATEELKHIKAHMAEQHITRRHKFCLICQDSTEEKP